MVKKIRVEFDTDDVAEVLLGGKDTVISIPQAEMSFFAHEIDCLRDLFTVAERYNRLKKIDEDA